MSIAIIAPNRKLGKWKACFDAFQSEVNTEIWPDIKDPAAVEMALLWDHPKGVMSRFPNLKVVGSFGAGVNHILNDDIPSGVQVVRCLTGGLKTSMTKYVLMHILRWHKNFDRLQAQQVTRSWDQTRSEFRLSVGILGLGSLGMHLAKQLLNLDIEAFGFASSNGLREGIRTFDTLDSFTYAKPKVVVNLLPLTKDTQDILNKNFFSSFDQPIYLINVARGNHLVEEDLIPAIESGQVIEAALDVFQTEPLPADHEFWSHPKVFVSPHVAAITKPREAAALIVENYKRMKQGRDLLFEVDLLQGY